MPELPEVEITRRRLEPLLVGRTVAGVETTPDSYVFLTPPATLRRKLPGRRVLCLERAGKYLLAGLDGGERLLVHLGMTGQLFAAGASSVRLLSSTAGASLTPERQATGFRPDAHTHLRLRFADGGPDVFFRDVRKLGKVQLLRPGEVSPRLARLGADALGARGADLYAATRARRAAVKALLLDQSVLAGVGNIYADEALFRARIRPTRRAGRLSRPESLVLVAAMKRVLRRSIETGGRSVGDAEEEEGPPRDERRVYGRAGQPCRRCRTPIRRVVIAGRSAHFCPRCQR
jgi:formamidopyrimidine-DNA glycosylase